MLVRGPWVWVDEEGFQRPIDRKTPKARSNEGPSFYARLRVSTEPTMLFRQDGPVALTEALDDQEQTLEAAPDEAEDAKRRSVSRQGAYPSIDLRVPLSLPDQPGKTIKRFRGTIPVVYSTRSPEPVAVIPWSEAKGRKVEIGDVVITVVGAKTDDEGRSVVALTARLPDAKTDPRDRAAQERVARRLNDIAQRQLDLVDDQTRPILVYPSTAVRRNEVKITLRVSPSDEPPHGPPDRLRVFGLTRHTKELPFDFKGVPLP